MMVATWNPTRSTALCLGLATVHKILWST